MVDLGRLMDVHAIWEAALPNVKPFYAVKCNDDVMVLKTLAAMGTGFDCSSKVYLNIFLLHTRNQCIHHGLLRYKNNLWDSMQSKCCFHDYEKCC